MIDKTVHDFQLEFITEISDEFGIRRLPRRDEIEQLSFSLTTWLAQQGASEAHLYSKLCRRYRIPFLPAALIPEYLPFDLMESLPAVLGLGARTPHPWLIIDTLGYRPVMAHYAPTCTDFQGFPQSLCYKVLISPREYERLIVARAPKVADVGARAAKLGANEYIEAAKTVAPGGYELEDGTTRACDEIVSELELQEVSFIPLSCITPAVEPMRDLIGSEIDKIMAQHDALCYAVLRNHYFVLAPSGIGGEVQDMLRQLDADGVERRVVTLAWAPQSFICARRAGEVSPASSQAFDARLKAGELVINPSSIEDIRADQAGVAEPGALLQWLLTRAVQEGASDLHLEQDTGLTRIRLRVDGDLAELARVPLSVLPVLTNLIKTACRLPLGTKNKILDGRFTMRPMGRHGTLECRVSIIPQPDGEVTVIRFASKSASRFSSDALNFTPRHRHLLNAAMSKNRGMIIITGPTGCGKSTTLYTLLSEAKDNRTNIVTIENPIEVVIDGVRQFATVEDQGFGFTEIFRGILRQDPDKIMVGEIRDKESADIAVRAALTGHLVLSTLHTNDALGVITRLLSMGIDAAQLADSLLLLQAQRLVPKLCVHCCEEYVPTSRELDILATAKIPVASGFTARRVSPVGCDKCKHRGVHGQQVIMEVFPVTRDLSELARARAPYSELYAYTRKRGWPSLFDDALGFYAKGVISFKEALNHVADFDPDFDEDELEQTWPNSP